VAVSKPTDALSITLFYPNLGFRWWRTVGDARASVRRTKSWTILR